MSTRGSALQRTVNYFREATIDEARVTFELVKEVMQGRLAEAQAQLKSQNKAASTPRRQRRTKAQIAADKAKAAGQTTIEEGARATGASASITI